MKFFTKIFRDDQNVWNIVLGIVFAGLLAWMTWRLYEDGIYVLGLSLGEFFLLGLAIFRLIRLFSYDKITQSGRDLFLDYVHEADGSISRVKPKRGLRRTMSELLDCPWCTGVWLALFVVFAYLYSPYSELPILVLAVAGVASLVQVTANMIGWTAERKKQKVLAED